ncbi:hypothetical protein HCQ94_04560 [Actinomyces sp. zg-332]|uniref:Sau3AI family type II restriction endonuclease n=1 Tax=Actinomyces sp. zg-332 TaxID=2708340 RepID=UPI00141E2A9A|nr:Sau3AI family type II restriction endonuclease [Actinomyces sp. zg-332]QPK93861.1 hypothetical protein HCQ94_04560 [Actinomyces sp. zg-332]
MEKEGLPYDDTSIKDILRYSQELVGLSFADILSNFFKDEELSEKILHYNNPRNKGSLGNLLEEYYFLYKPNNISSPDFKKVGLELKVTPYEKSKKGVKAGERLVITMIPNNKSIDLDFTGSYLEQKIKNILMIWYYRIKGQERTAYNIDFVNLYDIYSKVCAKDLKIILDDYKIIVGKIKSGNAHNLSESDTKYLGACTKGATADRSLQPQYYNSKIKAKRRAFSLKQSYMTYILNNYVQPGLMSYDSIFTEEELEYGDFDGKVIDKIKTYIGRSDKDLYNAFTVTNSKQKNKLLVNKILGVNTDNSEEFAKANIVIKTIRVKRNGIPRESMSFPKITLKDFVTKEFCDSYTYDYFASTRFLFIVFKENEHGEYILKGSKFWNMPIQELETTGKKEWEAYKNKISSGVEFTITCDSNGRQRVLNDLPKKSDNEIFHLRPHSAKSAYIIKGIRYGNGSDIDMDELPNGDKMTHQCFWLSNYYIANIIKDV